MRPQFDFDSHLNGQINSHCSPELINWEEPVYCECGQEIDKVPGKKNIAEILKSGEMNTECTKCGAQISLQLSVKNKAIDWADLYKLWQIHIDIFPAIECELFVMEA